MKNNIFFKSIVVAIFAVFIAVQAGSVEKAATPASIGQVVWVKGSVKAVGADKATRSLQRRSPIYVQDTIMTDKTSTGQVVFSDNSIVALREDTEFRIDQYKFGKDVPAKESKYVASVVKGGFRTITGIIPKNNPDNYQVNTPVATIAIQGTGFSIVYRNGQLYTKYYSGTPCVQNEKGRVCLDHKNPFSTASQGSAPVRTKTDPGVFKEDIQLVPASFSPVKPLGPPGSPGTVPKGGTVNSFCIG